MWLLRYSLIRANVFISVIILYKCLFWPLSLYLFIHLLISPHVTIVLVLGSVSPLVMPQELIAQKVIRKWSVECIDVYYIHQNGNQQMNLGLQIHSFIHYRAYGSNSKFCAEHELQTAYSYLIFFYNSLQFLTFSYKQANLNRN